MAVGRDGLCCCFVPAPMIAILRLSAMVVLLEENLGQCRRRSSSSSSSSYSSYSSSADSLALVKSSDNCGT